MGSELNFEHFLLLHDSKTSQQYLFPLHGVGFHGSHISSGATDRLQVIPGPKPPYEYKIEGPILLLSDE